MFDIGPVGQCHSIYYFLPVSDIPFSLIVFLIFSNF